MPMLSRQVPGYLKFTNTLRSTLQKRLQQTKPQLTNTRDVVPIFGNINLYPERIALRDSISNYTYANLFISAKELSKDINQKVNGKTNERVLFLCSNDAEYVITLWAVWMSGQIAVPLSPLHPKNILLYYANDTKANLLISTPKYADLMQRIASNTNTKLHVLDEKLKLNATLKSAKSSTDLDSPLPPSFYNKNNALIIYTSGTTGNPKGVVLSHKNLAFQVNTLLNAWKWTQDDVILHTLPLHHIHGIVNALLCPLYIGAKTVMLPKFNANSVWSRLLGVNALPDERKITVYMAVPTIYSKLIEEYERVFAGDPKMVDHIKKALKNRIRLMVSGSAPLPGRIFDRWQQISGHQLLERYGMSEIGMCLSNLYDSEKEPGFVGLPLPGVSVRLAETQENPQNYSTILECSTTDSGQTTFNKDEKYIKDGQLSGELLVKSDGVFNGYYNRPEATKKEFTHDGWFKTGDICAYSIEKNKFKILGRRNTDIIKTGGYKVSALEVETVLFDHPNIKDCVVVGLEDAEWGERVAAVVVPRTEEEITLDSLKEWAGSKLPKYCIPSVLKVVEKIPKNQMGKVNKTELLNNMFNDDGK